MLNVCTVFGWCEAVASLQVGSNDSLFYYLEHLCITLKTIPTPMPRKVKGTFRYDTISH